VRVPERDEQTVVEVLKRAVATHGERPFLRSEDESIGFGALDRWSNRLARGLCAVGLEQGQTVLLMFNDSIDFIAVWLATAKVGAIEVPINRAYQGAMLAHLINDSGAALIVIDSQFVPALEAVQAELADLRRIVCYPSVPEGHGLNACFEVTSFAALPSADDGPLAEAPRPSDLTAILYTSGTTGQSKGVMIYHAHAYEYSNCMAEALELGPDDVYFAPLPLFHIAGQWAVVYAGLIAGATVILAEKFSVRAFWPTVARYRANTTLLLDVMAHFLLNQPPAPGDADSTLDKVHLSAVIPQLHEFKRRFGLRVTTDLASTEMCAPLRAGYVEGQFPHRFHDLPDHHSCGRVVSDRFEARLVDENDAEVPVGSVGELVVRAKYPWLLMGGYWNQPEATAAAWQNLWLHTGDALYRDEEGNHYFVDRIRDVIRRRGENVSSMEIENVINDHDRVLESAVFGVTTAHGDEEIMAVVVLQNGLDLAALAAFVTARLPGFMVPRYFQGTNAIPKTESGKIKKYDLRQRGVGPDTWDRTTEELSA
jgi:crotonobetaine/carnitine-CoA ligase